MLFIFFSRFPTDENVKRKWVLAMKRLDVNAAGIWEPKKGDVLCSRHFKKTDFDRSTPNIKLKPGVIPSIFDPPSHLQVCLRHCLPSLLLFYGTTEELTFLLFTYFFEIHFLSFYICKLLLQLL